MFLQILPGIFATSIGAPWPLNRLPTTMGGAGRPAGTVLLTAFGGRGDNSTDNTAAFRRAFEHLQTAGGGTLVVPGPTYNSSHTISQEHEAVYRTMPLVIAGDFTTLRIESNARIAAICDIPHWPVVQGFDSFSEGTDYAPFVCHKPSTLFSPCLFKLIHL